MVNTPFSSSKPSNLPPVTEPPKPFTVASVKSPPVMVPELITVPVNVPPEMVPLLAKTPSGSTLMLPEKDVS